MFGGIGQQHVVAVLGYVTNPPCLIAHLAGRFFAVVLTVYFSIYDHTAELSHLVVFHACIVIVFLGLVRQTEQVVIEKAACFHVAIQHYTIAMLN